eukprot:c29752_g1_i1 orf=153-752(+)
MPSVCLLSAALSPPVSMSAPGDNDPPPAVDVYQCSICLDAAVQHPLVTPCGHLFCAECLQRWIDRKSSCPLCKSFVSEQNTIAIASICAEKQGPELESLFQCNICTNTPTLPVVLRLCGHLFCWPCLCVRYRNDDSHSHCCGACLMSFEEEQVIPLYVKLLGQEFDICPHPTNNLDLPSRPVARGIYVTSNTIASDEED